MIDASNPNYTETFRQIDDLRFTMEKIEKLFYLQIPQGLKSEFDLSKNTLLHWLEEIEFTLQDYNK